MCFPVVQARRRSYETLLSRSDRTLATELSIISDKHSGPIIYKGRRKRSIEMGRFFIGRVQSRDGSIFIIAERYKEGVQQYWCQDQEDERIYSGWQSSPDEAKEKIKACRLKRHATSSCSSTCRTSFATSS